MHTALSFLPLLLSIPLVAALLKGCAFVYKRTRVTWKRALLVSLAMMAAVFLGVLINLLIGGTLGQLLQVAIVLALYIAIGAVLLGPHCTLADGSRGSAKTRIEILATLVAFGIALSVLLSWVLPAGAA